MPLETLLQTLNTSNGLNDKWVLLNRTEDIVHNDYEDIYDDEN